ncbi:hypothetical protein Bca4012_010974 [Brassica carinata]
MVEKIRRKWSFALLRMECDKIGVAPYDGCLRTFVGGIKPFVVRLRVKILTTCFPARPLRLRRTEFAICRASGEGLSSPYAELVEKNGARHMGSWSEIGPSSPYGELVGTVGCLAFLGFGRLGSVGKPFSRCVVCFLMVARKQYGSGKLATRFAVLQIPRVI